MRLCCEAEAPSQQHGMLSFIDKGKLFADLCRAIETSTTLRHINGMLKRIRQWIAQILGTATPRQHAPPSHCVYMRKGGNRPLPLSSFLDPARLAQRHRHRLPKPKPPVYEDLDDFRKKVANNPYGM
jgi:hypothetical protein